MLNFVARYSQMQAVTLELCICITTGFTEPSWHCDKGYFLHSAALCRDTKHCQQAKTCESSGTVFKEHKKTAKHVVATWGPALNAVWHMIIVEPTATREGPQYLCIGSISCLQAVQ